MPLERARCRQPAKGQAMSSVAVVVWLVIMVIAWQVATPSRYKKQKHDEVDSTTKMEPGEDRKEKNSHFEL